MTPFRTALAAAALALAALPAAAQDATACLRGGADAVAPFEAAKQALIDNSFADFWEVIDPGASIPDMRRETLTADFRKAVGNRAPTGCFLMQRNDYSPRFVSEVVLVDFPGAYLYLALYAYRTSEGWELSHYRMGTDFDVMRTHLR
jgi:hypothetical protein